VNAQQSNFINGLNFVEDKESIFVFLQYSNVDSLNSPSSTKPKF
jgi:hypothetical protein